MQEDFLKRQEKSSVQVEKVTRQEEHKDFMGILQMQIKERSSQDTLSDPPQRRKKESLFKKMR